MPLVFVVVARALEIALLWLADRRRRLTGAYRTGYALVLPETSIDEVVSSDDPILMAWSPMYLLTGAGVLPVAIVRDASGIRSRFRDGGAIWTATSFRVVELLPPWTGLGPSGEVAVAVINAALNAPEDRIKAAETPQIDDKQLIGGDPRRTWLLHPITQLSDWLVRGRVRELVTAAMPDDASEEELSRQVAWHDDFGWMATRRIATVAAMAAVLLAELPTRTVQAWSKPWIDLTLTHNATQTSTAFRARAMRTAGGTIGWFLDRPFVSAIVMTISLFALLFANPLIGILAVFAILIGALVAKHRRGRSLKGWRPDTQSLAKPVPRALLWKAMKDLRDTSNPLYDWWLRTVLPRARMWVAVDALRPTDPARWLSWLDRNGQAVPIRVIPLADGRHAALAFSAANGHRAIERAEHIHWTLELDWHRILALSGAAGASVVIIDGGRPWEIETQLLAAPAAK